MCLQLLEEVPLQGVSVADVGCGSGILSIGACLLGAGDVRAVDIEPLSVEVAKENATLNGVAFQAVVGRGISALAAHGPFDVVVSNIISAVLIQIAPEVADAVKPGGRWIVSGIIAQNWPDVRAAAVRHGFEEAAFLEEDGWVAATFQSCTTM
jgi:ribosomal protein L11 methyltransferase